VHELYNEQHIYRNEMFFWYMNGDNIDQINCIYI